jgi:ferrous iron transport protein B
MPIYAFLSAAFFPGHAALVMTLLYFTGIVVGIIYISILDHSAFRGEPVPFVMELPNYRFPTAGSVARLIWDKAKDFLTRAFTVIFLASIIIWFLQNFDLQLNLVTDSGDSILAVVGSIISPIFAPLGFDDWRISTALITGFIAKESVVSTLNVLSAVSVLAPRTAIVFLIFTLLYTPCVAAIASVKRELGGKSAVYVVIAQCVIAWIVAFCAHLVINLFYACNFLA